jgi:formate/nitrite transporter FocA (FNT family)
MEHGHLWAWDEKDGAAHLWAMLISCITLILTGIFKWNIEIVCAIFYLFPVIALPLWAGIVALVKKEKWNPWYWFPTVIGNVIGGIVAIVVCLMFGIISF